jgi:competence protein ComEC
MKLLSGHEFWQMHPALLASISLLIGTCFSLFQLSIWTLLAFAVYLLSLRKWASLFLLLSGSLYAFYTCPIPSTPLTAAARFSISSLQIHQTPFHKNYRYAGTLYLNGTAIRCKIVHPLNSNRPIANQDYHVTGTLTIQEGLEYLFKAKEWTPIQNTWSLAELRFQTKEKIKTFLQTNLKRPRTALFLSALATGDPPDRQIVFEFGRLGLQHILAISGFHFGVLMAFVAYLFRFFLPSPWKWGVLFLVMTGYFVFIGTSPAVQRAWIGVTLCILAKLLKRRIIPLNILGAAMGIELLYNPLAAANLGFQFSFASCFGILALYQPIEKQVRRILPKRKAEKALLLSLPAQIAYLITSMLRRSFSLTLAVNIAILPILLFHFGKFPLLSLLYNLFFPALVGVVLFGLLAATMLYWASGSTALFPILDWISAQLLDLTSYPPVLLDRALYFRSFPYQAIPLYFGVLLCLSIVRQNQGQTRFSLEKRET